MKNKKLVEILIRFTVLPLLFGGIVFLLAKYVNVYLACAASFFIGEIFEYVEEHYSDKE